MNIALIAHDNKKALMQNLCVAYQGILEKHVLYSTGTTGRLIEDVTTLKLHKTLAGILGGEQQVAALITENQLDLLLYLRDPSVRCPCRCPRFLPVSNQSDPKYGYR